MTVKRTVTRQYQALVDRAASTQVQRLKRPAEGWIATARKALGMSGPQLGKRLGLSRARISQAEHAELDGAVTLKTLKAAAAAMGCQLVYAIVPADGNISDVVARQAHKKATAVIEQASTHMALEKQELTREQNQAEVEHLAQELARTMPADLWTEK